MVKWGIDKSEATGLPCSLQASEQCRWLYSHYRFESTNTVEFNLLDYGLEGIEKMTEMIRWPEASAKDKMAGLNSVSTSRLLREW